MVKVLVVDEQPIVREGTKAVLEAERDMVFSGEAGSAPEAFDLVTETDPDVVILDLDLKGEEDGLELCRGMKSLPDPPGVVVHTMHNSQEELFSSRISGADSFVHKGEDPGKLLEAIRETHSGKKVWFLGEDNPTPDDPHSSTANNELTTKEKQIFNLLVRRLTNSEIAAELSISHQTVKNHVSSVLRKLGASSRTDLL